MRYTKPGLTSSLRQENPSVEPSGGATESLNHQKGPSSTTFTFLTCISRLLSLELITIEERYPSESCLYVDGIPEEKATTEKGFGKRPPSQQPATRPQPTRAKLTASVPNTLHGFTKVRVYIPSLFGVCVLGKCRKIRLQLRVSSAQTNRRNLSKKCKISSKIHGARRVLLLIVTRLTSTVCQTLPRRSTVYFGFLQTSQPLICRNTLSLQRSRVLSQPETFALAQR